MILWFADAFHKFLNDHSKNLPARARGITLNEYRKRVKRQKKGINDKNNLPNLNKGVDIDSMKPNQPHYIEQTNPNPKKSNVEGSIGQVVGDVSTLPLPESQDEGLITNEVRDNSQEQVEATPTSEQSQPPPCEHKASLIPVANYMGLLDHYVCSSCGKEIVK